LSLFFFSPRVQFLGFLCSPAYRTGRLDFLLHFCIKTKVEKAATRGNYKWKQERKFEIHLCKCADVQIWSNFQRTATVSIFNSPFSTQNALSLHRNCVGAYRIHSL
jgi:hypothetical protein